MKNLLILLLALPLFAYAQDDTAVSTENPFAKDLPTVIIHTNKGDITLELFEDQAPASVENFLTYARDGHYDGTIFHRVISDFMIQGGGFDANLVQRPTRAPVTNEADNGLSNERGTVAMARTNVAHSATSQFFINVKDNPALNHRGKQSGQTWGYAVFGRVVGGMDVVETIRTVETSAQGPHQNLPVEDIMIESIEIP